MTKSWIYLLLLFCLFACKSNNSVNPFEEEGNNCSLTISTSISTCESAPELTFSKINQENKAITPDHIPKNSKIGICVYRSGGFDNITIHPSTNSKKAENIPSVKKNDNWINSENIQLRQPTNVYAYYPYNNECFIPAIANNPKISSDDTPPMIIIRSGKTKYLYGKAEKKGNGLLEVITPKNNRAAIRFNYAMAHIIIRIKNSESQNIQKVKVNNIITEALLSLKDGSIKPADSAFKYSTLKLDKSSESNTTSQTQFAAYIIPQTTGESTECELLINNQSYKICLTSKDCGEWKSGQAYVYTLSVKDNSITIESIGSNKL